LQTECGRRAVAPRCGLTGESADTGRTRLALTGMELHRYLQQRGVMTTQSETARPLGRIFWANHDGVITPEELLLNSHELKWFCSLVRRWGVEVLDSLIVEAIEEVGVPR
jgi:hypothetical protein